MSVTTKFYLLSLIAFLGLSIVGFFIPAILVMLALTLILGTAEGLSVFFYALAGGVVGILGCVLGLGIALLFVRNLANRWSEELGEERTKLTCLSFLTFLVLLWLLIIAVARF